MNKYGFEARQTPYDDVFGVKIIKIMCTQFCADPSQPVHHFFLVQLIPLKFYQSLFIHFKVKHWIKRDSNGNAVLAS